MTESIQILLVLLAVQVLFDLYARSAVTAAAFDAARVVAGSDAGGTPRSQSQAELDARPIKEIADRATGAATVATYTVAHGRDGGADWGLAVCDLPDGRRTVVRYKGRVDRTAQQPIQLMQLPTLAFPSHPLPLTLVPNSPPMEQEEPFTIGYRSVASI